MLTKLLNSIEDICLPYEINSVKNIKIILILGKKGEINTRSLRKDFGYTSAEGRNQINAMLKRLAKKNLIKKRLVKEENIKVCIYHCKLTEKGKELFDSLQLIENFYIKPLTKNEE